MGMLVAAAAALLEMPPFLPSVLAGVVLFGVSIPWLVVGFTTLTRPEQRTGQPAPEPAPQSAAEPASQPAPAGGSTSS
jgi:hypothetical protein